MNWYTWLSTNTQIILIVIGAYKRERYWKPLRGSVSYDLGTRIWMYSRRNSLCHCLRARPLFRTQASNANIGDGGKSSVWWGTRGLFERESALESALLVPRTDAEFETPVTQVSFAFLHTHKHRGPDPGLTSILQHKSKESVYCIAMLIPLVLAFLRSKRQFVASIVGRLPVIRV